MPFHEKPLVAPGMLFQIVVMNVIAGTDNHHMATFNEVVVPVHFKDAPSLQKNVKDMVFRDLIHFEVSIALGQSAIAEKDVGGEESIWNPTRPDPGLIVFLLGASEHLEGEEDSG
jgi:hypothetical protein